jgi:serine/threonine protein kinase
MRKKFIIKSYKQEGNVNDIMAWYNAFKHQCVLLDLKSYYEIGNIIGKGTFAKVYEVTHIMSRKKYALKTIEKKVLSKTHRNFVSASLKN